MSRFRSCQIQETVGHGYRVRCRRAIGSPGDSKNWRAAENAVSLAHIAELELPNKFPAHSLCQRGRSCVSAHLYLLASRTEKLAIHRGTLAAAVAHALSRVYYPSETVQYAVLGLQATSMKAGLAPALEGTTNSVIANRKAQGRHHAPSGKGSCLPRE